MNFSLYYELFTPVCTEAKGGMEIRVKNRFFTLFVPQAKGSREDSCEK